MYIEILIFLSGQSASSVCCELVAYYFKKAMPIKNSSKKKSKKTTEDLIEFELPLKKYRHEPAHYTLVYIDTEEYLKLMGDTIEDVESFFINVPG